MQTRLLFGFVVALATCYPRFAAAVSPTRDEMAETRRWTAAHLELAQETKSAQPCFSFGYDGKPAAELLETWELKRASRKLDDQRTQRTLTWTDPKTGLEVRCMSVEYSDFPVVEWTVYLRNTGNDQHADARKHSSPRRPLGSQRRRRVRPPRHPRRLLFSEQLRTLRAYAWPERNEDLRAGGRTTDRYALFRTTTCRMPGGGVIVVVGWPGQWASSFTRDAAKGLRITAGQELTRLYLKPGEEIRTPLDGPAVLERHGRGPGAKPLAPLDARPQCARSRAESRWPRSPLPVARASSVSWTASPRCGNRAEAYLKAGIHLDYWWTRRRLVSGQGAQLVVGRHLGAGPEAVPRRASSPSATGCTPRA